MPPKTKATKKVVRKTVKPVAKPVAKPVVKNDCCGGKDCCCPEGRGFWTALVVIVLLVVVGYFAYNNYLKNDQVQYSIEEVNGVTTVSPGPGMTPDGPPMVVPPTAPPTN